MPRIETCGTLAASLGPPAAAAPGALSLDDAADRLTATGMLRHRLAWRHAGGAEPRVLRHAVHALTSTARALALSAAAVAPDQRGAWWEQARDALRGGDSFEAAMARLALEWATTAPSPRTDPLFDLPVSAWITLDTHIDEALTNALLAQARTRGTPCWQLDASPPAPAISPRVSVASDFEHEAVLTAATVIERLNAGLSPVALMAEDRLLVRRVRALLERQSIVIADETGWKLSTTRAGAGVMAALKAALPAATVNDWFAWVKGLPVSHWSDEGPHGAVEQARHRERVGSIHQAGAMASLAPLQHEVWTSSLAWLAPMVRPIQAEASLSLHDWLGALAQVLAASGVIASWLDDAAGIATLAALRIDPPADAASAFGVASRSERMPMADFIAWVDAALEAAVFLPPRDPAIAADVVITPLHLVPLRPFAAMVFPGLDERQLSGTPAPHALLSVAQAQAIGLVDAVSLRRMQRAALAHALALPDTHLLRRASDEGRSLAASPAWLALELAGQAMVKAGDPCVERQVAPRLVWPPQPVAGALLPTSLSVNACDALRACPYRFFSRVLLSLRDPRESPESDDRRDHGNWLHDVLDAFHLQRGEPKSAELEVACLREIGETVRARMGFEIETFLPFEAGFEVIAQSYVTWLHARDAQGITWQGSEVEFEAQWPGWPATLKGRVDRIDQAVPTAGGVALELLDYKTGSEAGVSERVKQPLEDTQLAAYAALAIAKGSAEPSLVRASYLRLSERKEAKSYEHPNLGDSAQAFVAGMGQELSRIQRGAALPALGDGPVCEYCEARGLCRRDHWHRPAIEDEAV